MNIPDNAAELIKKATEARARLVFHEDYGEFSESMRIMADTLLTAAAADRLSDASFREMLYVVYSFWRDCNQARFQLHNKPHHQGSDLRELMRSAQIDQFINSAVISLNGMPNLTDDTFEIDVNELDGS